MKLKEEDEKPTEAKQKVKPPSLASKFELLMKQNTEDMEKEEVKEVPSPDRRSEKQMKLADKFLNSVVMKSPRIDMVEEEIKTEI